MAINYLRRVQARYQGQGQSDVSRGIAAGEAMGKLLGNLGTAIKGAQKDALANKLMNTMDAPRAALVNASPGDNSDPDPDPTPNSGGPQPGSPSDNDLLKAMAADTISKGTPQDLGTAPIDNTPQPTLGVNMDTNNPQPTGAGVNMDTAAPADYTPTAADDASFAQSMAAARLGSGPAVGSTVPAAAAVQPAAQPTAQPAARPAMASGTITTGTRPHTGGVQELDLMKEMQAMQQSKAAAAATQQEAALRIADLKAKAAGSGIYSTEGALKRAQLAEAQAKAIAAGQPKLDKNAPPSNFNGEPVRDDDQLNDFVDKQYGSGASTAITNLISDGSGTDAAAVKGPDGKPVIDPLTGQPKIASNLSVPLSKNQSGAVTKSANISLPDLQTIVKQKNALRKRQNLSLFRVPGEDQTLGSQTNPYPIQSKLDMGSRASGTYARLNGQIYKIP